MIFDLDGTVVDTLFEVHQAINLALDQLNLPRVRLENSRKAIGPGPDEFIKYILLPEHLHHSQAFYAAFAEIYRRINATAAELFDGMAPLLDQLKGNYALAMATNKARVNTQPLIEKFGLDRWFQLIVTRDEAARPKPEPDMLLSICRHFDIEPQRSLMVGDTDNDVISAAAAKMPCALALWGYSDHFEQLSKIADFSISHPLDLLNLVNHSKDRHVE